MSISSIPARLVLFSRACIKLHLIVRVLSVFRYILPRTNYWSGTDGQVFPIVAMAFTAQAIMTASSRMTYAFARDRGLPFSRYFAVMHKSGVPVNAVLLSTVCVVVFGCIYLGSDSALNAILSSSVVFLNISYSIPSKSLVLIEVTIANRCSPTSCHQRPKDPTTSFTT